MRRSPGRCAVDQSVVEKALYSDVASCAIPSTKSAQNCINISMTSSLMGIADSMGIAEYQTPFFLDPAGSKVRA
jgi:hypothetical protein